MKSHIFFMCSLNWTCFDAKCWSVFWNVTIQFFFLGLLVALLLFLYFRHQKYHIFFFLLFSVSPHIHFSVSFGCCLCIHCSLRLSIYKHMQTQTPTVMLIHRFTMLRKHISTTHLHNANFFLLLYCFVTVIVSSVSYSYSICSHIVAFPFIWFSIYSFFTVLLRCFFFVCFCITVWHIMVSRLFLKFPKIDTICGSLLHSHEKYEMTMLFIRHFACLDFSYNRNTHAYSRTFVAFSVITCAPPPMFDITSYALLLVWWGCCLMLLPLPLLMKCMNLWLKFICMKWKYSHIKGRQTSSQAQAPKIKSKQQKAILLHISHA